MKNALDCDQFVACIDPSQIWTTFVRWIWLTAPLQAIRMEFLYSVELNGISFAREDIGQYRINKIKLCILRWPFSALILIASVSVVSTLLVSVVKY